MIFYFRERSAWTFATSAGGGAGVGFFAVSGGEILLNDPSGAPTRFHYGGAGAGLDVGERIPGLGKFVSKIVPRLRGQHVGQNGSTEDFLCAGTILLTDQLAGRELRRSDITGMCVFVEAGVALVGGASVTALMLNVNPIALLALTNPATSMQVDVANELFHLHLGPKAVLFMANTSVGIQVSAGVAGYCGYLG